MGKIFDAIFPMIANYRDNLKVRKKIHPTDDEGNKIEPEGILAHIENSNELDLKVLEDQYGETLRIKEKIEDKAKTNIIGISISITLIMGASGILSVVNDKYQLPILSWITYPNSLVGIEFSHSLPEKNHTPVTPMDHAIQGLTIAHLQKYFPQYKPFLQLKTHLQTFL